MTINNNMGRFSKESCNWNGRVSNSGARNNERASLVPAAAVIPALIAYIKVVAVKKLVVGFVIVSAASERRPSPGGGVSFGPFPFIGRGSGGGVSVRGRAAFVQGAVGGFCWQAFFLLPEGFRLSVFYFEEIRVFKASHLGYE